jgi:phospholipase C
MDLQQFFNARQSRRTVLRQIGALAGASFALNACSSTNPTVAPAKSDLNSINHILIACQENRSFDTYFGYYPRAGAFGVPPDYSQPDGHGGKVNVDG